MQAVRDESSQVRELARIAVQVVEFAQAVQAGGLLFISGQIPLDPVSGEVVSGGIAEQTRQVMEKTDSLEPP